MKRFEVIIAGTVESIHTTRESAEARLAEIKNSFYALVHPTNCIYVREV